LLTVLAGALLLAAQSSLAQTRLGITAAQRAGDYRALAGKRLTFVCHATDGATAILYGTDTYTADSPICAAAIHAGALRAGQAGVVSIDVGRGAKEFRGSQRNGLTSRSYGASPYSYTVARDGVPGTISWTTVWNEVPADFAEPITVTCPAGGALTAAIWGTDVYTIDSGICVAAVHAGAISAATGGSIAVRRARAPAQYAASDRHGVQSKQWGSSRDAFSVAAAGSTSGDGAQPCTQGVTTTQAFDAMKATIALQYGALIDAAQSSSAQIAALVAQRARLLGELESHKQENLRAFCPPGPQITQNIAPPAEAGPSRIDTSSGGAGGAATPGLIVDSSSQPSVQGPGSLVAEPLGNPTLSAEPAPGSVATAGTGTNGRLVATPTSTLSTSPPPVATVPTGFTARVLGSGGTGGAVALSWQPVTGALKYRFEGPAIAPEGLVVTASSSGVTLNDVQPGPQTWRMAAVYENDFWDRDKMATASTMVRFAPPRSAPWLSKYGAGTAAKVIEHYRTVCPACIPGMDWDASFLPLLGGLGARMGVDCTDGFGLASSSYGDCGEASYVNVTDFGTTRATSCFALNSGGILCYAKSE
jgi:hypothetical protein